MPSHERSEHHEPSGTVPSLARERSQRRGGVRTLALPLRDRSGSETLTLVGPDNAGRYSLQLTGVRLVGRASGLDRDHLANQVAHLLIRLEADAAGVTTPGIESCPACGGIMEHVVGCDQMDVAR